MVASVPRISSGSSPPSAGCIAYTTHIRSVSSSWPSLLTCVVRIAHLSGTQFQVGENAPDLGDGQTLLRLKHQKAAEKVTTLSIALASFDDKYNQKQQTEEGMP